MQVAAIVGVKNEVSLIQDCLDHLYAIGVDYVIAEDCGSTDGTQDLLASRRGTRLEVFQFDESQDLDTRAWGAQEARLARDTGADWVVFLDADEFLVPDGGSVKEALAGAASDVLTVNRFNVALGPAGPYAGRELGFGADGDTLIYVRRPADYRRAVEGSPSMPWIRGVPVPKVIVRPSSVDFIRAGHHAAVKTDGSSPRDVAANMVIAHLPFSSRERFVTKVRHIADTLRFQQNYHSGEATAWHWKRWIELSARGLIDAEYDLQVIDQATLQALRTAGDVETVADYLRRASAT